MSTIKLKELLDGFDKWVKEGKVKKIPYESWRFLKEYENDQVRIERDGWGELGIFSETRWDFIISGCPCDDGSLGTYLSHIHIYQLDDSAAYDLWQDVPKVVINEEGLHIDGKNINNIIDEATNLSINRKENDSMNLFKNFDFGSCSNDNVKMSMYGIAVKNATGTWVSYDPNSGNIIDVDILNFDAKYLYKMPVAIKDVKAGDTIIHCRKPVFVTKNEDGKILCVDPAAAEEKIILPVKNMFGFDFVVKIINLFDGINGFEAPSADQPFGNNLWMFMMLEDKENMNDFLPLMLLSNNGNGFNPLMLLALSNDKTSSNDLLPLLLLSQTNTFGQTK